MTRNWNSSTLPSFEQPLAVRLENEVRILCMILTCPDNVESLAQHVYATWGQRCSKLVFVSSEDYEPLGVVQVVDPSNDSYDNLWNKTREGFRYVYENYGEEYDWFLKADDDTYVIMENLRHMLYAYNANMPIYFGYKMMRYNVSYMSGGAGYILSRTALHRFMLAYKSSKICPKAKTNGIEDFYMGICLQNVGVHLIDTKFAVSGEVKARQFPLDLSKYLFNWNYTIPEWLRSMAISNIETGNNCCSNYSISFHYTTPETMYLYEFLIYKLRVFSLTPSRDQLPTQLTLEQVSTLFPLEQNVNIKDLSQMPINPENF